MNVIGSANELNTALEHAGRVADFLEFAELMCIDALERDESCGGHFRTEHQTEDGEAKRNDDDFCHSSVWEYSGDTFFQYEGRRRNGSWMDHALPVQ